MALKISNNKLIATISPEMEKQIINAPTLELFYTFFDMLVVLSEHLSSIIEILLPNTIIGKLYDDKYLRSLAKDIERIDNGISFLYVDFKQCNICIETKTDLYQNEQVNSIIAKSFTQFNAPIIFDDKIDFYKKIECTLFEDECVCRCCKDEVTIHSTLINNPNDTFIQIKNLCKLNINTWMVVSKKQFTVDDLKKLVLLYSYINNADKNAMVKISSITILDNVLLNDIRKTDFEELKMIANCISRAVLFPPTDLPNHDKLSVDWHYNDKCPKLDKYPDYKFYKIDVVPENRSGASGAIGFCRLLMIKKKESEIFIAGYTRAHYFNKDFCEKRIKIALNIQ